MSEDEAINILKTMCTDNFCIEQLKIKQSIETILDLYKQEKEKNSKYIIHLTDEQYRKVIDNAQRDIEEKWKDKIRAKIKELKQEVEKERGTKGLRYSQSGFIQSKINILKELLEEE